MDFVSAHGAPFLHRRWRRRRQFDHPLVVRAKLEIAACLPCLWQGALALRGDRVHRHGRRTVAPRASQEFGYTRGASILRRSADPATRFRPTGRGRPAPIIAAAADRLGAISAGGKLHDRASYRYFWQVLERPHQTGRSCRPAVANTGLHRRIALNEILRWSRHEIICHRLLHVIGARCLPWFWPRQRQTRHQRHLPRRLPFPGQDCGQETIHQRQRQNHGGQGRAPRAAACNCRARRIRSPVADCSATAMPRRVAIAERVYVGQIACELGATSRYCRPRAPGHFHVGGKGFKYHMARWSPRPALCAWKTRPVAQCGCRSPTNPC